jgi:methylthioribose-1-phosphate isomerase
MLRTIQWTGDAARLLDQTKLPDREEYLDIRDEKQMWDAIRRLVVRGAPAIGVAAALGVYLGARGAPSDRPAFDARLDDVCGYLATARPTAVNLFWAIGRMKRVATAAGDVTAAKAAMLAECLKMIEEDAAVCRAIGEHGLELLLSIANGKSQIRNVLTHCNAGALATAGIGTALAPIYVAHERGLRVHVWVDETRPLLQGARITAFELHKAGVACTLICDNMAATVMSQRKVDAVIVGADRIAANGDVANKIGTHAVAILARHFSVPFYVAAPLSTIDLGTPTGAQIPIEQRDAREIREGFGRPTAPQGVDVFNPAFDVTPCDLVSAIITQRGVVRAPYERTLAAIAG